MQPLNLQITFADGTTRSVLAVMADLIKFEEKYDRSVADFGKGMRLTWLVFIAWTAETRTKQTALDFDAYVESVASVDLVDVKK